ncbi:MAG: tetratricopeptide repeat protein, partial [Ilumatobacter sp.]|nr:tetratricopeptide repeat protein [Ilumatobacter sp.]
QARLLDVLGLSLAMTDDNDGADTAFRRELELWTELGDDGWAANTLGNLAEVALRQGRLDDAARHQLACLEIARMLGQPLLTAFAIVMAAQISARLGRWRDAMVLQLTADVALADVGYVMFDTDLQARNALLENAAERVEPSEEDGTPCALPLEAAIDLAATTLESATRQKEPTCPSPTSAR